MKNIKITILIIILIASGTWLYFNKNQSAKKIVDEEKIVNQEKVEDKENIDTSDWLTYRNEEYGFEFKYPEYLEIREGGKNIYVSANLSWPQRGISLDIYETEKTLEQFIETYNSSDVLPDGTALAEIRKQEDYNINNNDAKLLIGSTALGIKRNMIFVKYNNRNYVIEYMDEATNEELIIINSFQFID